jgi:hypothetical protein
VNEPVSKDYGGASARSEPTASVAKSRLVGRAVAVSGWCGSASAVGYLLHGPLAAAVALAAVVLAVCAVAVLRPVLLGDSDPRSPFVRFMLLVCVLMGRPPGDYLPSEPSER